MSNKVGGTLTGIGLLLFAIFFFALNAPFACGGIFLLGSIICFGIAFFSWYIPHSRDQRIIEAAYAEQLTAPSDIPTGPPPMTSPESARLFIPEPL